MSYLRRRHHTERPNIVFSFSDQQRFDTLGCYGQSLPVTPCLDQLATESVRFQNAFTCQPVCGPARSCLQTGLYATETGCFTNAISLSTSARTLAHHFNEAGYDTAYIGNVLEFTSHGYNGCVFEAEGNKREFIGYRADCINNFAIEYLPNRPREKPFFLFVSHIEPHNQNDHMNFEGPDGNKEKCKDYDVPGDLEGTGGDWRQFYPDYLGECHSLDANAGRLIDLPPTLLDCAGIPVPDTYQGQSFCRC